MACSTIGKIFGKVYAFASSRFAFINSFAFLTAVDASAA
jgi:hypothetical protein